MEGESLLTGIEAIVNAEIAAAAACSAQLSRVDLPEFVDRLAVMKRRHAQHIERLNALLARRDGAPQAIPQDLEGPVTRDYRYITGMPETGPALISMQATEEELLERYEELLQGCNDGQWRATLEPLAAEIRAHVQWLTDRLSQPWEEPESIGVSS